MSPEPVCWLKQFRSASLGFLPFSCYPKHRAFPPGRLSPRFRKWGLYNQWQIVTLLSRTAQVGREFRHLFLYFSPIESLCCLNSTMTTLCNTGGRDLTEKQLLHCMAPAQPWARQGYCSEMRCHPAHTQQRLWMKCYIEPLSIKLGIS